jgi:hypothetical protein
LKKTIICAFTGMLLFGAVGVSQVAGPVTASAATTAQDPGPVGSFNWKGFNWEKRFWAGVPHYNGQWAADNVSNPDANGYVTLSLTNPTGNAPVAAEFQSTRQGFGYGTYSTTVEKDINSLQKEAVWGCLFTYDPEATPGMNEIDLCEASAWGGGAEWGESWPVTQGHGYWFDASKGPGLGNNTTTFPVSSSPILTHKLVWEPGKLTFETYEGEGFTGTLLKRTVLEGSNVPVPAKERVIFNLWVTGGGGGTPNQVKPEKVIVRDFSFTPAVTATPTSTPTATATPVPTATIKLSYVTLKTKTGYRNTIKWTGTTEKTLYMYVNGVKKTISNTGSYISDVKKGSTTSYKLCDSKTCSTALSVKVSNV